MRLEHRLRRLERAAAERTGPRPCPGCGGPSPGMNLYVALGDDGEPRWGRCGNCGLALDERGLPCAAVPLAAGWLTGCKVYGPGAAVEAL